MQLLGSIVVGMLLNAAENATIMPTLIMLLTKAAKLLYEMQHLQQIQTKTKKLLNVIQLTS